MYNRALTERVSPAYLPGVTCVNMPETQGTESPSPAGGRERDTSRVSQCEIPLEFATNVASDDETAIENGVASEREERSLQQMLITPVPFGGKMFCSVTRHHTTLKVSEYLKMGGN